MELVATLRHIGGSLQTAIDEQMSDLLGGPLRDTVRDLLTSSDSFAIHLFGRQNLNRIFEQHSSKEKSHLQPLGFLITMERWRTQILSARTAARDLRQQK